MVYRHRFLLPGPATSIPGGIAQDKPADCASHPSTPVAGFLAGSSSLHQCVQEKIAGGRLRSVCTLKPDLVRRNDMSTAVLTNRLELSSAANTALKAAARFWFGVTVTGQLMFGFAVASFYSLTALRGDFHAWKISNGYIPGVTKGNPAVVMHLTSAVIVMLAGAVQLVPQVRNRFPAFHHWNGRIYMLTAVTLSLAGLYMQWIRGSVGDLPQHIGSAVNAILIWLCAAMALRYAMARDFKTHRRWALRLFLVVSASWFY